MKTGRAGRWHTCQPVAQPCNTWFASDFASLGGLSRPARRLLLSTSMQLGVAQKRFLRWSSLALALAGCDDATPSPAPGTVYRVPTVWLQPPPTAPVQLPAGADCIAPERDWLRSSPGDLSLSQLDYTIPDTYTNAPLRLAVSGKRWAVAGTVEVGGGAGLQEGNWMDAAVTTFDGFTRLAYRSFGGVDTDQYDQSWALQSSGEGYFLGGQFTASVQFDPAAPPIEGQGEQDAFLVELSPRADAVPNTSFTLGGPGRNERVWSLAVAADGAVYAAGPLKPGAVAAGEALEIAAGGSFYVARIERGQLAWIHTWPGDFDGPVLAALSDGSVAVGSPGAQPFVRRYSSAGELEWEAPLAPALSLRGLAVDEHDQITAVGIHRAGFDASGLGAEHFCAAPDFGAYAVQLNADGGLRWARAWGSPSDGGVNAARVIAVPGGVAVTGQYGQHDDARTSRAIFGYVRVFDDDGEELGQLVAEQGTIIADLALAGDRLRLLLRPRVGTAAGVVDVPVPGNGLGE